MAVNYKIKYDDKEYWLSDFVEDRVSEDMYDFNYNRTADALSQVNGWKEVRIVLMDSESIEYYTVMKID